MGHGPPYYPNDRHQPADRCVRRGGSPMALLYPLNDNFICRAKEPVSGCLLLRQFPLDTCLLLVTKRTNLKLF
eukprot:scaffold143132_cov31-Prasinocladus_malaysianus.AAC.1